MELLPVYLNEYSRRVVPFVCEIDIDVDVAFNHTTEMVQVDESACEV